MVKHSCKVDWDVQSLAESKSSITKKGKRRMNIEGQILIRDITHFMFPFVNGYKHIFPVRLFLFDFFMYLKKS